MKVFAVNISHPISYKRLKDDFSVKKSTSPTSYHLAYSAFLFLNTEGLKAFQWCNEFI